MAIKFSTFSYAMPCLLMVMAFFVSRHAHAQIPLEEAAPSARDELTHVKGFISKQDSVGIVINALAAQMKKPAIVSAKAAKKQVTGSFDLTEPGAVLAQLESDLNLTWYSDGLSLYVYDSVEMRSLVWDMQRAMLMGEDEQVTGVTRLEIPEL